MNDLYVDALILRAEVLSNIKDHTFEKTLCLLDSCPSVNVKDESSPYNIEKSIEIEENNCTALAALGLYLISSDFKYADKLLNEYLIALLSKFEWKYSNVALINFVSVHELSCFFQAICLFISEKRHNHPELVDNLSNITFSFWLKHVKLLMEHYESFSLDSFKGKSETGELGILKQGIWLLNIVISATNGFFYCYAGETIIKLIKNKSKFNFYSDEVKVSIKLTSYQSCEILDTINRLLSLNLLNKFSCIQEQLQNYSSLETNYADLMKHFIFCLSQAMNTLYVNNMQILNFQCPNQYFEILNSLNQQVTDNILTISSFLKSDRFQDAILPYKLSYSYILKCLCIIPNQNEYSKFYTYLVNIWNGKINDNFLGLSIICECLLNILPYFVSKNESNIRKLEGLVSVACSSPFLSKLNNLYANENNFENYLKLIDCFSMNFAKSVYTSNQDEDFCKSLIVNLNGHLQTQQQKKLSSSSVPKLELLIICNLMVFLSLSSDNLSMFVVNFFQNFIGNPPTSVDSDIIYALAKIIVHKPQISLFNPILTIFRGITIKSSTNGGYSKESSQSDSKFYKFTSSAVIKAYKTLALNLSSEDLLFNLFIDLMEIFILIGVNIKKAADTNRVKASSLAGSLGLILPSIACIIDRLPQDIISTCPSNRTIQIIRDFWLYSVLMGFCIKGFWPTEWYQAISIIAKRSCLLVTSEEIALDLKFNRFFKDSNETMIELNEIRESIVEIIKDVNSNITIVKSLSFVHCHYLTAIFYVEYLRLSQDTTALPIIFIYLENKAFISEKNDIWQCLACVIDKIFAEWLNAMVSKRNSYYFVKKNEDKSPFFLYQINNSIEKCTSSYSSYFVIDQTENEIVNHAELLLVKFIHPYNKIRLMADTYLTHLVEKFPHVLWDIRFLKMAVNLVQALTIATNEHSDSFVSTEHSINGAVRYYLFKLASTPACRKEILSDLKSRCITIFWEVIRWAPSAIHNLLSEIVNQYSAVKYSTSGLELLINAINSAEKWGQLIIDGSYINLDASLSSKPYSEQVNLASSQKIIKNQPKENSIGHIFISHCNQISIHRSLYIGKITSIGLDSNQMIIDLLNYFDFCVEKCKNTHNIKWDIFEDKMMLATSILVTSDTNKFYSSDIQHLLHHLCFVPVMLFTCTSVKIAVNCWSWIIESRSNLIFPFLCRMVSAWEWTLVQAFGIFDWKLKDVDPFTNTTELDSPSKINRTHFECHLMWIEFLHAHFDLLRPSGKQAIKLLASLVNLSLKNLCLIKRKVFKNCLSMHRCARTTIYRFFSLALRIIQSDILTNSLTRSLIRQKIYFNTITLLFSQAITWPIHNECRSEIEAALDFWNRLILEKRYFVVNQSFIQNDNLSNNQESFFDSSLETIPLADKFNMDSKMEPHSNMLSNSWLNTFSVGKARQISSFSTLKLTKNEKSKMLNLNKINGTTSLDFSKWRILLLHLIRREIERLYTWFNPLYLPNLQIDAVHRFNEKFPKPFVNDKSWPEYISLLWDMFPLSVVYLPSRFPENLIINKEVTSKVHSNPFPLLDCNEAGWIFLGSENFSSVNLESPCLYFWDISCPLIALWIIYNQKFNVPKLNLTSVLTNNLTDDKYVQLEAIEFCPKIYSHQHAMQIALNILEKISGEEMVFYVPQLVQALRYDYLGLLQNYMIRTVNKSQLLTHQLLWNLKTNTYIDEDSTIMEPVIGKLLEKLSENIVERFTGNAKEFYKREFDFFSEVTNISGLIKPIEKPLRNAACKEALSKVNLAAGVYLPTNPDSIVDSIDYNSAIPMQSAAKAPFLARFFVKKLTVHQVEQSNTAGYFSINSSHNSTSNTCDENSCEASAINGNNSTGNSKPLFSDILPLAKSVIFKVGDDVRQDVLALQFMKFFKKIYDSINLDIYLHPYQVVATAPGCGVIECVPDARSRDQLGKQTDVSLYEYFLTTYGDENSEKYQKARICFINSMAAYSVFTFILQIKDRHNGNIMIDNSGHIIHIDFGFMFESSPGGNIGFEPDLKLTYEMMLLMGGDSESVFFKCFLQKCIHGFLAIRPHVNRFIVLVSLMLESGLPCFRGETIKLLRQRFSPNIDEKASSIYMAKVVADCSMNFRTRLYDMIQYAQNQIPY